MLYHQRIANTPCILSVGSNHCKRLKKLRARDTSLGESHIEYHMYRSLHHDPLRLVYNVPLVSGYLDSHQTIATLSLLFHILTFLTRQFCVPEYQMPSISREIRQLYHFYFLSFLQLCLPDGLLHYHMSDVL